MCWVRSRASSSAQSSCERRRWRPSKSWPRRRCSRTTMEGSDDGEAGKMDPWTHSRNGFKPSGFLWMSGLLIPLKKSRIQATLDLWDEPPSTIDRPVRMHETGRLTQTHRTGWQMVAILSVKELRRNSLEIEGSSSSASQIWSGLKHVETTKLSGPVGPWDWQQCFYRGGGGRGDLDFKHFGPRRGHRRCVGVGCLAGCDSQEQGSHWKRLWRQFFHFFSLNKWGWVKTLVPSVHPK